MGTLKLNQLGYTLVEMVVTAALIGILSVGIVSVFISTVQGGKTARSQANVKTQGDYAITSMERMIRNAIKLPVCSADGHEITFEFLDDNGEKITQAYRYLEDKSIGLYRGVEAELQGSLIISGQVVGSIEVTDASFVCTEGDSFSPGTVTISLTLSTLGDTRQQTTQQFQTTIAMRNIP